MTDANAPRQLLIVDDDATFVRVLSRALGSRGFEAIGATRADEARQLARRHQPRYCVLDLKLGEENGLKLISELHALVPEMRILLLTGYASIATAVEAIKRGAADFITKPFQFDALLHVLRSAL
ncbi:response regulator, partial [Frateuria sp.]|uniref:response regulator n=1 Tax=Frateuria sp. TaxID=2211372 RepID=UPI003F7FE789